MRTSPGERFTWLAIGGVFLACIAILGGLFWMSRSAVDGVRDASRTAPTTNSDGSTLTDLGVLDASWTAPTTNTDGSALTDLTSYRVYYSTTNFPCRDGPFLTVGSATARPAPDQRVIVRLRRLTMGQLYYVAVAAGNSRGGWSACTPVISARARPP